MKKVLFLVVISCCMMFASCKQMDDNYDEYLENVQTYSPAVTDLTAKSSEAGSLTLMWKLPENKLAEKIEIDVYKTSTDKRVIGIPNLQTEYTLTGLELQGYEFHVYTIDSFGNRSVPVIATFSPIPGRE